MNIIWITIMPTSLKLMFRYLYLLLINTVTATCDCLLLLIASLRSFVTFYKVQQLI